MKTKITILTTLMLAVATTLFAQTTYTVSSAANTGAGTLRQLIIDAAPDDSIVIPADYTIIVESEIAIAKNLKINGQGATVKVTEPGISNWRIFNIGNTTASFIVSLNNLILQGGDVSATTPAFGGVIYAAQNLNLTVKNCTVTNGKGTYGGGLMINNATGMTVLVDGCTFSNNTASTSNGGGAAFKGVAIVRNSVFENNKSGAGGAAFIVYNQATVSHCIFKGNEAAGTYGGAVSNNNTVAGNSTNFDNCSFISNKSTGANSTGGFVNVNNKNHVATMTNCTFYNNSGTVAGAIWNRVGYLTMVNCTLAGNITTTAAGGALSYLHTTAVSGSSHVKFSQMTLVNNIFAYNYNSVGRMDIAPYVGANETTADAGTGATGPNNIVTAQSGTLINLSTPVAFVYGDDPNTDSALFVSYTTNINSQKIPVLDITNNMIPLMPTSIAISKGIPSFGDPELVPGLDQRGKTRNNPPSVGSFEFTASDVTNSLSGNEKIFSICYQNPAVGQLNFKSDEQVNRAVIIDLTGRTILSKTNPAFSISLANIPAGIYILRFETSKGNSSEKLIVK